MSKIREGNVKQDSLLSTYEARLGGLVAASSKTRLAEAQSINRSAFERAESQQAGVSIIGTVSTEFLRGGRRSGSLLMRGGGGFG